jgi:hypothetical protein
MVKQAVDALGLNGGQRFVTQAGETAGLLLRQVGRLGQDAQHNLALTPDQLQADVRAVLIGVFNSRPDGCEPSCLQA